MSSKSRQRDRAKTNAAPPPQPRVQTVLYSLVALVALAGLADSVFLTVAHLAGQHVVCGGVAQCDEVLASAYATVFGMPVAAFGVLGYFGVFGAATLSAFGYVRPRLPLALLVGLMFLGTLWFLYVQAFILKAYCQYCLLSAACTFVIAGLLLAIPPRRTT
ncbi:hypothetical protein BH20VER1_BH20VER1_20600 [soil metagenome]